MPEGLQERRVPAIGTMMKNTVSGDEDETEQGKGQQ